MLVVAIQARARVTKLAVYLGMQKQTVVAVSALREKLALVFRVHILAG